MENWALIGPSDESPTFPFLSQCFLEYEVGYQLKKNIATETLPLLTPLSMKPIRGHLILSQFFIFSTQRCALFLLTLLFIGSTQLSCLTTAEKESPRKRLASLLRRAGYLPFVVRKFNDDPGTGFFCRSSWPDNRLGLSYNYLWLMFVGVIPVCVMVLFYGKIVHNLWHSERQAVHGAQLAHKNTCHSEHYLRILLVSKFVDKRHRLLHS